MKRLHRQKSAGFALVAAVVMLVILSGIALVIMRISRFQSDDTASTIAAQQVYLDAAAGVEIFVLRLRGSRPNVATNEESWPGLPSCPASATLAINSSQVSITCTRTPSGTAVYSSAPNEGSPSDYSRYSVIYEITSVATRTIGGMPLERAVISRVEMCQDRGTIISDRCF